MANSREIRLAWLAGLGVVLLNLIRVWYLAAQPELAVTNIPDDAFYYLKLAQNRLDFGFWTFDGASPTSGFHLLHAYLLVVIDFLAHPPAGDWIYLLRLVGSVASICLGVAATLVMLTARRLFGAGAGWWALVIFVCPPVIAMGSYLMESHLVILAAAAVGYLVSGATRPSRLTGVWLLLVGALAALTRSDFSLWPGLLWVATLIMWQADQGVRFRRASWVLAGAVLGFGFTLWHTQLVSGSLLQTSVTTKLRWSSGAAANVLGVVGLFYLLLLLVVLAYAALVIRRRGTPRLLAEPAALGSVLTVLGFGAVYSFGAAGLQNWYGASFVVPAAITLAAVGQLARPLIARYGPPLLILIACGLTLVQLEGRIWPHQVGMLHASERLVAYPQITHLGSWNAGILGFTSGRVVTNLDGLVDDRAAAAGAAGDILGYLHQRQIDYLIDHADTVASPQSGQGDDRLVACAEELAVLSEPDDPRSGSGPVQLYRLIPGCS